MYSFLSSFFSGCRYLNNIDIFGEVQINHEWFHDIETAGECLQMCKERQCTSFIYLRKTLNNGEPGKTCHLKWLENPYEQTDPTPDGIYSGHMHSATIRYCIP